MDDTQRLQSDDDDGEDTPADRLRPVANLHMFAGLHGPAQDFPIYLGQNLIGRHASCDITLPAQSVSKKHAILEVKANCHTICDNGSLNKTRRSKAALTPNVRYALTDGDFLMFADVACRYSIHKKVEEASVLEESEDDSVLVPGTQGALAIEKTPGVAIRRMVRGAVLAQDSGDEDAEGQKKTSEGGEGFESFRGGHKTTDHGSVFSPITDTVVPESDEENDTSTSNSRFPSLNLRCDSDTDTHDTPTRVTSFTPSSLNFSTPSSLKEQTKEESRKLLPVVNEEKKSDIRTDGEIKLTLLTGDVSEVKDDQEVEPVSEAVLDSSYSDGDGHVQGIIVSDTTDTKLKEVSTLITDEHVEHDHEETVQDNTINKQTDNAFVQEEGDAGRRDTEEQRTSDETSPDINVTTEEINVKLVETGVKMKEVDFYLDSDTDVDEEDTTTSQPGVMKTETLETKTDGGQEENNGRTLGMVGAVSSTDGEKDTATSEADLETGKTHHININSDTDVEAAEDTNIEQKKSGSLDVNPDSDTDVEDELEAFKSKSENGEVNTRKDEDDRTSRTTETSRLNIGSESDVENTADIPKPDVKNTEQESRSINEDKRGFHLDSDTDVEDEVDVSNTDVKKDERTTTVTETNKGLHLDSDTDVDEDAGNSVLTKGEKDLGKTRMGAQEPKDAFNLDSDTDVDEDDPMPGASNAALENKPTSQVHIDDPQLVGTAKSYSEKEEIAVANKEAGALQTDDDTEVDEEDVAPVLEEAPAAEQTSKSECEKSEMDVTSEGATALHMDSDTDVEDNDVPGLEKAQTDDRGSVCEESVAVPEVPEVETPSVPADNSAEEEETQKTDSENSNYDSMATQCYLEPQEQESDLPDEEEATQAYVFSSTWAEPDPFKRPADPIGVLQISAVTLDTSEEEIDENAIAETQPYCSNAESPVRETPELGNDSVIDLEATQPADSVEESGKEVLQLPCNQVSQEDTQPVSQYLSSGAPEEAGSWLHLKRDVPASVWARAIQHEGASTEQKEGHDKEDDAKKEDEPVSSIELEATQPYTLGIPSLQQHPTHVQSPDMPPAEKEDMELDISAVPPTDNKTSQPCNQEEQTTDDQATQGHSQSAPDSDDTQTCSPLVQSTGDDDTQPSNLNVVDPESLSVPAKEEETKETSNKDQVKLHSRRGLSRSRKKAESAKNAETAAEVIEHPEEVIVPDSLPETLSELNAEEIKQSRTETTEELTTEKGGRRRGARRKEVLEVEDKSKTKEEVLTASRKRTNRMVSDVEPSTSGINEKVKRKQPTGKSLAKVAKKELEDDHEEESVPTPGQSGDISSPGNIPINPAGIIETQTSEDDKKDIVVKHMPEKTEDQPNDKDLIPNYAEQKGNRGKSSAVITESKELMVSDGSPTQVGVEPSSDIPNKRVTTKTHAATKLKKSKAVEAESRDSDDKEEDVNIDQKSEVCQEEVDVQRPSSRTLATKKVEEGLGKRKTRKSGAASAGSMEQKKEEVEDATASITGQNVEVQVSPTDPSPVNEKPRRLRRNLTEDIKEASEKVTSKRSMSLRGGEKKVEEKEPQGNSEDSPVSNKMTRRMRHTKVETEKSEEVTVVGKTPQEGDAARKPRRTRKNSKDEQITEKDIGNKEKPTVSETQTRRTKKEQESVEKSETVKETISTRAKKNSADEDIARLEDVQSKKSGRIRKGSKEELKTEQKEGKTLAETQKADPVGQKNTLRTRKNAKDGKKNESEQQDEVDTKPERSTSRARRKTLTEETKTERERKESLGEGTGEQPEEELTVHEEKSRLNAGKTRRTATKEDLPQVSTPVAARKRGQPSKAEVEAKRKKSDEAVGQKPVVEAETTPKRGRPRKVVAETSNTQTGSADAKEISPPDPSPSRSTRQRASSASSNPPEVRTPRRTSRMSAAATSPYVPHSGATPKVLFTGVVDAVGEGIIRSLGGDIADSVFDCTHLVTDRVRRTVKFLCALARGIPIVTLDWIDKCKKSGCFLSPTGFLVNDKEQEKIFNFVLAESLQKAKKRPLLQGYEIHITSNVKPEPEHMKDIIRCSGATFLPKMPRTFKEKCVIVSCPEDAARCKSAPSSVPVTTAEFILSGILRQEANPSAYLLSPAAESPGPAPAKRRR